MAFGRVLGILVVLSFAATGATMARNVSHGGGNDKGKTASITKHSNKSEKDKSSKSDKLVAKNGQGLVNLHHAKPQEPIVMGRSASVHHKTKLHHLKVTPVESSDTGGS